MEIQTGNLQSLLHCRHPKNWHFWFGIFLMLYIFEWKNKKQNLLDTKERCICKLGKTQKVSWNLSGVYYWFFKAVHWDHLSQLFPFTREFHGERAAASLGANGRRVHVCLADTKMRVSTESTKLQKKILPKLLPDESNKWPFNHEPDALPLS